MNRASDVIYDEALRKVERANFSGCKCKECMQVWHDYAVAADAEVLRLRSLWTITGVTEEVRKLLCDITDEIDAAPRSEDSRRFREFLPRIDAVLSVTNPTTPERDVEAIHAHVMQEREACARIAEEACLVLPDGGSPTEEECEVAAEAARRIRARSTRASVLSVLRCADDVLAHQPKGAE